MLCRKGGGILYRRGCGDRVNRNEFICCIPHWLAPRFIASDNAKRHADRLVRRFELPDIELEIFLGVRAGTAHTLYQRADNVGMLGKGDR